MKEYTYSLEAVCKMFEEAFRVQGLETGGILVGFKDNNWIVTDTIISSSYAEREAATYFQSDKDTEILNFKLRRFQQQGYDFRGYWHVHPFGMTQLSGGDIATCKSILQDPGYCINNHLIMSIITGSPSSGFPLFSYVVSLDKKNNVKVEKISVNILPKSCICKCMACFNHNQETEVNDEKDIIVGFHRQSTENNETGNAVRENEPGNDNSRVPGTGRFASGISGVFRTRNRR